MLSTIVFHKFMKIPRRVGHLPNFERDQEPNAPAVLKKLWSSVCLSYAVQIEKSIHVTRVFPIDLALSSERNIEPHSKNAHEKNIMHIKYIENKLKYRQRHARSNTEKS